MCSSRQLLDELVLEFVMLINVLMFRVLGHKCGYGCDCVDAEDTIKRITLLIVRLVFWRRPKRPELKEWTAVGQL